MFLAGRGTFICNPTAAHMITGCGRQRNLRVPFPLDNISVYNHVFFVTPVPNPVPGTLHCMLPINIKMKK